MGVNGLEAVILIALAVLILGPERLPIYASQLAQFIKAFRRVAMGAQEQIRQEVGPELADVDWRKLDPRQYDPRAIIKDALLEDRDGELTPSNMSINSRDFLADPSQNPSSKLGKGITK